MTTKVKKLISEIEALDAKDFQELKRWFLDLQWQEWDEEIHHDSEAGKLDFLIEEALREKKGGNLKEL